MHGKQLAETKAKLTVKIAYSSSVKEEYLTGETTVFLNIYLSYEQNLNRWRVRMSFYFLLFSSYFFRLQVEEV